MSPHDLPTDAELAILDVLWRLGPSSVRQVHEALGQGTGYTTTLKLMQLMVGKGLVSRNESRRTHIYRAAAPRTATQRSLVRDLADRAFGGSAAELVLRALHSKPASPDEIARIRALLDDMEGK